MSGHSHAKTVLHRKRAEDAKRGKVFSKMSRLISVASRDGADPEMNPRLKQALEEAKRFNMPKTTIERAIKKGSGDLEGENLEEFVFEAYGPGQVALIIEGITDNKNRSLGEIKQILVKHNGKLAGQGSVKWLFEQKGCITLRITNENEYTNEEKEDLELKAIDAGAEDVFWHNDMLDIYTEPDDLDRVKKDLLAQGLAIESSSLDWVAKDEVEKNEKEKKSCERLFEALDDNDSVQEIYSNLKI